ncbi:MAG: efflux RND transporter periplasmic adaptor subunit [Rhodospirillaceae bacterium]|nr:efflux RND transporter periplasmic adaptor subunit [Rhodospirillaceae bacterium]
MDARSPLPAKPTFQARLQDVTGRAAALPRPVLIAVAVVLIAGAGWLIWGGGAGTETKTTTQKVVLGDVEDTVTAVGKLQPLQYVDVGTQVSGQLKKLHVTYGATVTQGQLLAEIDPTIYQARVNAGEAALLNLNAQLSQRQAERTLLQQQLNRQTQLLAENATSQNEYDTSLSQTKVNAAQIEALGAQIKQQTSTLNADRANLGYTQIFAPMSGVVVDVIAKQGQTLNANQTAPIILRIADLDTMTVYAQVSEADVTKLRTGMNAYFTTLGQTGRRRYGTLRQIIPTPEVVNNVVLYNSLFDVQNPDHDLYTQMSAQVFFLVGEAKNVPIVPVAALKPAARPQRDGTGAPADGAARDAAPREGNARPPRNPDGAKTFMVRVKNGGDVEERTVTIGVMNRLVAEVKSGLNVGDEVVIDAPTAAARPQTGQGNNRGPRI